VEGGDLSADGHFGTLCSDWLAEYLGAARVMLTPSCTAALELATAVLGLGPGDEVVMPSFTSAGTAVAVLRSGATPVFADIEPGTLNLDPAAVAEALTARTRAIVPVHYAGVACDMESLGDLARERELAIVEDAAHATGATWRGSRLGAIGDMGCLSFHGTKNLSCGEGGALILREARHAERAETLRNKGTNRRQFLDGVVPEYTWVDRGGSFLTSELNAAVLWAQLESLETITTRRRELWDAYHGLLSGLEQEGRLRRPEVPADRWHNAHIYHVLLSDRSERERVSKALAGGGIEASFHFVPLHSSPAGRRFGRVSGDMAITDAAADRLLRLPLWVGMTHEDVSRVADDLVAALA
jgi:dTDP-4-amino-4,6-dideoxygalactose transaminase